MVTPREKIAEILGGKKPLEETLRLVLELVADLQLKFDTLIDAISTSIPFIFITYPKDGSRKSVEPGTLTLDFLKGDARLPDGTIEKMSDALENTPNLLIARSYRIETDQNITYQLDDGGQYPLDAGDYIVESFQQFRSITIITTTTTRIAVRVSSLPDVFSARGKITGTVEISDGLIEIEIPTILNGVNVNIPTAGTRKQLIVASLGAKSVFVQADPDNTGVVFLGGSDVSSSVYGAKLRAGAGITIDIDNVNKLWVDTNVSGDNVSFLRVF